jgi:hypothetical protein
MLVIERVRDGRRRRDGGVGHGDAHLGDGVPCLNEARVAGGYGRVWWGAAWISAVEEHCEKK